MYCQRCGIPCDQGQNFCPRCINAYYYAQASPTMAAAVRPQRKPYVVVTATLLVVLSAGLFAARGGNFRKTASAEPGPHISIEGSQPHAPALSAPSEANTPVALSEQSSTPIASPNLVVQSPATSPDLAKPAESEAMPALTRAYLDHLSRIESMRQSLGRQEASNLTAMLTSLQGANQADASSESGASGESGRAQQVANTTDAMTRGWAELQSQFAMVEPPADCTTLAQNYSSLLKETTLMMNEVLQLVGSGDPNAVVGKLQSMQGTTSGRIDRFAASSEAELNLLCSKYKVLTWFHIAQDIGK